MKLGTFSIGSILLMGLLFAACGGNRPKSNDITGTTEKVVRIIDGNTLELESGLSVDLIGVEPTVLSKEWLGEHVRGQVVILTADSDDPKQTYSSSMETVRAYVKIKQDSRGSVNGLLLRLRKSKFDFSYCKDSLNVFKQAKGHPVLTDEEIYLQLRPATFLIEVRRGDESWCGTGFYINEKGLALTNYHVLPPDANDAIIYYYNENGDIERNNSRTVESILATWKTNEGRFDVTLFNIRLSKGEKTPYLPLVNQHEHNGAKLAKLGNPTGETCNYQTGNLSKYDNEYGVFIHSCPSNYGDSGGPVVNEKGEVVGINQSVKTDVVNGIVRQVHGIACAVDIVPLKNFMDEKGIEYGQ